MNEPITAAQHVVAQTPDPPLTKEMPPTSPSWDGPDGFRTRLDDEIDRHDAELAAEIKQNQEERTARAQLPPPAPRPVATLTLAEDAWPEQVAEQLVVFYGIARARQIREGLVEKLRFFRNRRSATWDLVWDDTLGTRPASFE